MTDKTALAGSYRDHVTSAEVDHEVCPRALQENVVPSSAHRHNRLLNPSAAHEDYVVDSPRVDAFRDTACDDRPSYPSAPRLVVASDVP